MNDLRTIKELNQRVAENSRQSALFLLSEKIRDNKARKCPTKIQSIPSTRSAQAN